MIRLSLFTLTLVALAVLAGCAGSESAPGEDSFHSLFDGQTLAGWHSSGGGSWTVEEDGIIVGRHAASDPAHGHLISDAVYRDFTARLDFKVTRGDSGFYFRVKEVPGEVGVEGFQAEVDTSAAAGGLYETGGRAWVVKPSPSPDALADYFEPHGWNRLKVRARADRITTWLNGHQVADLAGEVGRRQGRFAFQLHGNQDMEVRFRNAQVKGEPVASD